MNFLFLFCTVNQNHEHMKGNIERHVHAQIIGAQLRHIGDEIDRLVNSQQARKGNADLRQQVRSIGNKFVNAVRSKCSRSGLPANSPEEGM